MAKVIKRGSIDPAQANPDGSLPGVSRRAPVIERSTVEAKSQAQDIRARAQAEADEILDNARREAEALLSQAKEKGYAQGRDQGASELVEAVARSSKRLQQIENQLVPQIKDLALGIAKKILGKELSSRPEAVVELVRQALAEKARQRREISLRVNPEDLVVIRENRGELLEILSRAQEISIREDPDVARFGVIIETDAGTIDAQLETQLAVLEGVLKSMP
ncbi:MAG: FliH/SctL family protein [Myxococcota bacterium]|nr:FliH/SctL family protein [Myxococcota bacterium]